MRRAVRALLGAADDPGSCRMRRAPRPIPFALPLLVALALPSAARAFDAFSDTRSKARFALLSDDGLRLVLKGDARFGLYDVEGEGGFDTDSTTDTATIGTRSAYAALDRARLAFRLETPSPLAFYSQLRFTPDGTYVEGAWIDLRHAFGSGVAVHGELGLHAPLAATDRLTIRKSLAERIYWDQPEMHAAVEASASLGPVKAWLGGSVAMMRPLGLTPVNDASDRGSTLSVVYNKLADSFSGIEPVYGVRGGVAVLDEALSAEGFAYLGTLSREAGTAELSNNIPYYTPRAQRDALNADTTYQWFGGRLDLDLGGVEQRVEFITSTESKLARWTGYYQAGYRITPSLSDDWLTLVAPRLRLETYRIIDGERLRIEAPNKGLTWDWDIMTLALEVAIYRDIVTLHVEYSVIGEIVEGDGDAPLAGLGGAHFENNEFTAQLELRF